MRARTIAGLAIALMSLALTGCPERIRIGDITRDPARFFNREVTVAGRVNLSYGAFDKGVYEIDDGTGRIWIFTEKYGVPSKDGYIGVTGKIVPGITYNGKNYATVLRETRRRTHPGN